MKKRLFWKLIVWVLVTTLALPPLAGAQAPDTASPPARFRTEQLQQMLAPIALYPDALIAQILMASTYPLEVVQADRWMKQNPGLKGDQLDAVLQNQNWDVSVMSLCHFPSVLSMMNERLDWTTNLGDAVLAQEAEVMDSVQYLRRKAYEQGNLRTTEQQRVVVEDGAIMIEPPSPTVVYVPTYNPTVVYGPWWYPAYPPPVWYPYYPGAGFLAFTAGVFVAAAIIAWSRPGWRHHSIDVDINRTTHFNRNVSRTANIQGGVQTWQHNPQNRRGVAYRDQGTAQRYGQARPPATMDRRPEARGYDRQTVTRPQATSQPQTTVRQQPQTVSRPQTTSQPQTTVRQPQAGVRENVNQSAFASQRDGKSERLAGERGQASRGNRDFSAPQGGASSGGARTAPAGRGGGAGRR